VRNGDIIRLDVAARRIDLLVDGAELARRAAIARPAVERPLRGYAQLYHDHVLQADAGCDFDFLTAPPASASDLDEAAE
jgi:dihydroxy-acid dehydratase